MLSSNPSFQHIRRLGVASIILSALCCLLVIGHAARSSSSSAGETNAQSSSKTEKQQQPDKIAYETAKLSSEFDRWTKEYLAAANPESLVARGKELAAKRRLLLKDLILIDPARALALAVPSETTRGMPSEIQENLEEQINAYGDYLVVVSDEIDPVSGAFIRARVERTVVIRGKVYKAAVFGRWLGMTSKKNIPINGIAIDDVMAVNESPVRTLPEDELIDLSASRTLAEGEVAVEIGGEVRYFKNDQDLSAFTQALVSREMMIGPDTEEHKEALSAEAADGLTADSTWTEGPKTVLFIRIDFPDKTGEPLDSSNQPLTVARAQNLIDTQVSPFYVNNSYNKTSMTTTVTPVVRMPQSQSFYFNNTGALFTDSESAARAAGFEPDNFNLDVFAMSYNQGFPYAGVASVGIRHAALNGFFDLRVTAHELGHNYGLSHANLWRTTDGTVIGNGSNIEYGNPFDTMGGGGDAKFHFNAQYKRRLDWLTDANVQTVTNDGVYRVFAHDSSTPGGIRVIKIKKNATKNYWVEFRQLFTNNSNAMNGAIINWDYLSASYRETQLLDMTPNTSSDATDAPLLIGQSFNDNENRIRMTVLGKGNTTPESLDVRVELNVGCTFSLGQTSQSFSASGGEGSIPVNTLSGCLPPATSNNDWLAAFPTETGTVRYTVAANYDSQSRTGTITIAGQTFTVQESAATTACAPRPSGLVAWWRGEGNALDQTGVNNGTLVSNMTFGGGKIGGGFLGNYSNNAGVVEVPDSSSLALTQSMTFEGWLKVDSYGGTVIERRSSDFLWSYSVSIISNGDLNFVVWYNGHSGVGVNSDPLPLNQFVHFAASLDDATGQVKMYINGSLVRQFTITQRPFTLSGAKTYIGNINGITDELSVYNRALSASEVQAIYSAGIAATGAAGKCLSTTSPPPAPTANTATNVTSSAFTSNWSSSGGATGYRLDVSTSNSFGSFVIGYQDLDVGNVLNRSVSGLSANTSYFYRVRAYNTGGASGNSNIINVTTSVNPPPAPTANTATNVTSSSLTANWSSSSGATGYRLDVSTSNSFGSFVSGYQDLDVGNNLSRSVTGLSGGVTYYYRVRAYNTGGTSGNSSIINVTTPVGAPSAPTANAATGVTSSSFTANWSNSSGATGYRLDVSTSNSFGSFVSGYQDLDLGNVLNRSVSGLNAGTTYYYRVRAYNVGGTSGNSGAISVTTAVPLTVQSNPTGRSFTVDGVTYTSTQTFTWTPGSSHTISTTSPQGGAAGTQYVWSSWSDNGAISHTVVGPSSNTTYTANFTTQYFLTMNAGTNGTVSPPSGWYNIGTGVGISATPNPSFVFNSWSGIGFGSFSGTSNPTTVTMNGPITQTAAFAQPLIQLLLDQSGPSLDQLAALDSILFLRDPFPVVNSADVLNLGVDRNTRVIVFVTNLQLAQGETSSAVVVNLVDSNNQSYDVAAEDVRFLSSIGFTQVIFRLPNSLSVGTCTIKVKAHSQVSNGGTIRIRT